jgi:hypothetical protein
MLRLIHNAGVDVFRLNMSHGQHDKLTGVANAIRDIEKDIGTPLAIFADLQGPKIRTGAFANGSIKLRYGAEYKLVHSAESNDENIIPIPHQELLDVLEPGDVLKLDDGKLQVTISERNSRHIIAKADTPLASTTSRFPLCSSPPTCARLVILFRGAPVSFPKSKSRLLSISLMKFWSFPTPSWWRAAISASNVRRKTCQSCSGKLSAPAGGPANP